MSIKDQLIWADIKAAAKLLESKSIDGVLVGRGAILAHGWSVGTLGDIDFVVAAEVTRSGSSSPGYKGSRSTGWTAPEWNTRVDFIYGNTAIRKATLLAPRTIIDGVQVADLEAVLLLKASVRRIKDVDFFLMYPRLAEMIGWSPDLVLDRN